MKLHEIERLLTCHGFQLARTCNGSHRVYASSDGRQHITIACHRGGCLGLRAVARIQRELRASVAAGSDASE